MTNDSHRAPNKKVISSNLSRPGASKAISQGILKGLGQASKWLAEGGWKEYANDIINYKLQENIVIWLDITGAPQQDRKQAEVIKHESLQ